MEAVGEDGERDGGFGVCGEGGVRGEMVDREGVGCEEGAVRMLLEWRVCHGGCWCWEDEGSAWVWMSRGDCFSSMETVSRGISAGTRARARGIRTECVDSA